MLGLALAVIFLRGAAFAADLPPMASFQPPGMWIWDNWFAYDGQRWHAFYLELPQAVGPDRRWTNNDFYKHVGHAVSANLTDWQDAGPALVALADTWNDRHIATGSIIQHENRWWMFFTGRGRAGDGVGLALSDDLTTWKTEPRPLFPLINGAQTESDAAFAATWAGEPRRWAGISDPYIYPEPIDGWFYLVLCARVLESPIEESGCLALLKSRDLRQWESAGIVAWPHSFERMETPQL
jgi:beta-fructofuranosidase